MSLTPQITLTATLMDYSGAQIGSSATPAYLRVALCGFGQSLPRIAGTAMIGKIASWPGDIAYTGSQITVMLWGNDVIAPAGTYYAIAILDANKNVIQSGIYQFTGTQTIDLSNAVQIVQPGLSPYPFYVLVPFSSTPVFLGQSSPIITFEMTLTGAVTSSSLSNLVVGQLVTFIIHQDATGSHPFTFPAAAVNSGIVNPAANSTSVQTFVFNVTKLTPTGPMTWQ